jgi:AraC-like DNA-binding protein
MFPTTISSWALLIAKALEADGHNAQAAFEHVDMDPAKLRDPNARYSYVKMTHLWQHATELTKDSCFGFKAARQLHPTTLHALGFAWMASATLKEALERLVRYLHIVNSAVVVHLDEEDDCVHLVFPLPGEIKEVAYEAMDAGLAVIIDMCRTSYGADFHPLRMSLLRLEPLRPEKFTEYFQCPIKYSQPENVITFGRAELEALLPTSNAELAIANDKIVADYLAALDRSDVVMQVKTKLIEQLPHGDVTEDDVASAIHMSRRSLQRKLKEQGASYKELLDGTRSDLAKEYIRNSRLSINEITYMLGFSEPSNFTRAFKRWTGHSPTEFRSLN